MNLSLAALGWNRRSNAKPRALFQKWSQPLADDGEVDAGLEADGEFVAAGGDGAAGRSWLVRAHPNDAACSAAQAAKVRALRPVSRSKSAETAANRPAFARA